MSAHYINRPCMISAMSEPRELKGSGLKVTAGARKIIEAAGGKVVE